MKKRIVSFLMALVMAVSLLPVSAFAADGNSPVSISYTVNEDTVAAQVNLTRFTGYLFEGDLIELPIYQVTIPSNAKEVTFVCANKSIVSIVTADYDGVVNVNEGTSVFDVSIFTKTRPSENKWISPDIASGYIGLNQSYPLQSPNGTTITELLDVEDRKSVV